MTAVRLFIFATAVLLAGCGNNAHIGNAPGPNHYWLFIDESGSVSNKQKSLWPQEAKRPAGRLNYGDAISIYPIHARTAEAAPIYHAEISVFDVNGTRSEQEKAKTELFRVRREAVQGVMAAIHPPEKLHVRATDVVGAFDHFRPDQHRKNVMLIFSDGLESADAKLNLERSCLNQTNQAAMIEDIGNRKGWSNSSLAGASVFFILPSVGSNDARRCNDPGQLRRFYHALIGAMGGRLVDFNTQWSTQ